MTQIVNQVFICPYDGVPFDKLKAGSKGTPLQMQSRSSFSAACEGPHYPYKGICRSWNRSKAITTRRRTHFPRLRNNSALYCSLWPLGTLSDFHAAPFQCLARYTICPT